MFGAPDGHAKPGAPPRRVRRKGVLVYVVLDSDKAYREEAISHRYPESAVALSSDFLCYFTDVVTTTGPRVFRWF